jgi:hypothetical protein
MATIPTADGWLDADALAETTGWTLETEGLCRGDVCVPTHGRSDVAVHGLVDLRVVASLLCRPLALDAETGDAVLGESVQQLVFGRIDDLGLRDIGGDRFDWKAIGRKKKVLVAWASW